MRADPVLDLLAARIRGMLREMRRKQVASPLRDLRRLARQFSLRPTK
jgi:hypothetical protein